jgi:hypothetical protein
MRLLKRTSSKPLEICEVTNRIGEVVLEATMTKLGWRCVGKKGDLDGHKVDYTYRKDKTEIDIQLKSKNIGKQRRWAFDIFKKGEKLDLNFYGEPGGFLFLVAPQIERKGQTFIEIQPPQIALIPGEAVVKHFEEASEGARQITFYELKLSNGEYKWSRYFGIDNIEDLLAEESRRQEDEILKKRRQQKKT